MHLLPYPHAFYMVTQSAALATNKVSVGHLLLANSRNIPETPHGTVSKEYLFYIKEEDIKTKDIAVLSPSGR